VDEGQHQSQDQGGSDAGGDPTPAWEVEHRLSRIEALLLADLDKLGEAVLGAAVTRLDASISALVARIDGVDAPSQVVTAAELSSLHRRLDDLGERLDVLATRLDPG
jgi:hypothetical protein